MKEKYFVKKIIQVKNPLYKEGQDCSFEIVFYEFMALILFGFVMVIAGAVLGKFHLMVIGLLPISSLIIISLSLISKLPEEMIDKEVYYQEKK